jgi:hypothetical protein
MGNETVQLIFQIKAENAQVMQQIRAMVGDLSGSMQQNANSTKAAAAANREYQESLKKTDVGIGQLIDSARRASAEMAKINQINARPDVGIGQLVDSARKASAELAKVNAAQERNIQLIERQGRLAGSSGSGRVEMQRQFAVQDYGKSTADIARINEAYRQMAVEAAKAEGAQAKVVGGWDIAKGILFSNVIHGIISAVKEATVESAIYAARTQQMNVVMDQLARTNGLSVAAVRQQADAVKALGITTQESRNTVSQMIFAQLDLAKATDLARLSQNAAKIAGISSSEALNGIINGIRTQQIEVLRTYGIQVNFEQAFIRGAAAMGKQKETLTDYERANIALNEVLQKGPRILGTYEISLSTASGQMQSMQRNIEEARNALGEGFVPILQRVVGLLNDSTKSIQENGEAYQALAKHITSVGLAIAAGKLTPGGPVPKAIVGAAVGIGAEILLSTDQIETQVDFNKRAIESLQKTREELVKKYQSGQIKDKESFIKEDRRLNDLQLQIEQNFTEGLAQIYKRRRDAFQQAFPGGRPSAEAGDDQSQFMRARDLANIPDRFDLGRGRGVTRQAVEQAIAEIGVNKPVGPDALTFRPDPASAVDALLGQFTGRIREATKSAQSGLDKASEAGLTGEEKIQAQRRDAINRVLEDFKQFNKAFKEAAEDAKGMADPEQRKQLEETIGKAQAQLGGVIARINRQFDIELQRERRDVTVADIQRGQRISGAQSDAGLQQMRQRASIAESLAKAQQSDRPGVEAEEKLINKLYEERIKLAKAEYDISKSRAAQDMDAAWKTYNLNKDQKVLKDAQANKAIADIKSEAQLTKEKLDAEADLQTQILAIRRKQREEQAAAYENAFRIAQAEKSISDSRSKDELDRRVKLAAAQTLPGNEAYISRLQYQQRVQSAQQEYKITQENIEERRKAALIQFQQTKNSADLEKSSTQLRIETLNAAYKLESEIANARVEREVEISNIRKQQTEELRQSLGSLYDALKANGKGGFKDFLDGYFSQIKKTLFVNLGEEVFRGATQRLGGIIPGQEKIDPVTGKGTGELTQLGRILRGTPLGVDPAKLAADRQINAQDRNTKAIDTLTGVITGVPGAVGGASGIPGATPPIIGGQGGGIGSILGTILGGGAGGGFGGMVIKNASPFSSSFMSGGPGGGVDASPDFGGSGFMNSVGRFFSQKKDAQGNAKFSPGATALAAAAAIPGILGGIDQGGLGGGLKAASAALGAASSIPGPQQPFILGASVIAGLLGTMFTKDKYKEWQENMNERLSQKFQMPNSINRTEDLAGSSVDYDFRGRMRTFQQNAGTTVNVNVSTMDAKSFMDVGPMLAESVRAQYQLGHPLQKTLKDSMGLGV